MTLLTLAEKALEHKVGNNEVSGTKNITNKGPLIKYKK